jgi:tetratricopeptide (TPR) repeat protein
MSAAQRPRLRSAALVAVLVAAPLLAAAQAGKPAPVKEPYWGAILFDYYQERYFTAITGLMASQHFDRVPLHADEAEILRGGLLLSYGLHEEAGRIFAALIDKGAAPSVRDRAWYFLAKIRYQRGLPQQAEAALDRVQGQLPAEVEDDRGLLAAQLMMARSDFAGAAAMLQALPRTSGGTPYALYNLGVALIKSGDTTGGARVLNQLGTTPAPTEEIRSLRDKTNVALGFAALQDQRADDARAALARVRLNGLHSNKALLGFGWAAAAKKDTRQALVS